MTMKRITILTLLALLSGCDRDGRTHIAYESSDAPGVVHLGELEVMTISDFLDNDIRAEKTMYSELGSPGPGNFGGATINFTSNGGAVCVMMDPESVFWKSMAVPRTRTTAHRAVFLSKLSVLSNFIG